MEKAQSTSSTPPETEMEKAQSTSSTPPETEMVKAQSTSSTPPETEMEKAQSTASTPPETEMVKAQSTSSTPPETEMEKAQSTSSTPPETEMEKAQSTSSTPSETEMEKAQSTSSTPSETEMEKAQSTASTPPETEMVKAQSTSSTPPETEMEKAQSTSSTPPETEMEKAQSTSSTPSETEMEKAQSTSSTPPETEMEKAQLTTSESSETEERQSATSKSADCDCKGCAATGPTAFQPKDDAVLSAFKRGGRRFLSDWYEDREWITLCTKQNKVFCAPCRYAKQNKLITFSGHKENAFTTTGFNNYKKGPEKFDTHEGSDAHGEAVMKCTALTGQSIVSQLNSQVAEQQQLHRNGLIKQISALRYLLRQGLPIRGHHDKDGNLYHLLQTWAEDNEVVRSWLQQGRFMSHDHINELITLMGHDVLRSVLARIKANDPAWFALIADEATDVACNEQLNISVRYVDYDYNVHEDSLGLYRLTSTDAATITAAIKDTLLRTGLPLKLCRGQAYDGAANMKGHRSGVATRIKTEEPAAVPVHCWAHSLNLCLQDTCRQIAVLRDALDLAREIDRLINYSPKRKTLFNINQQASGDETPSSIKPLCPTRWTVRTAAIESILSNYTTLMDTMQEVNATTRDEYGLKAGGVLAALEKFNTLFALRLGQLLFSSAEEVSTTLQTKDLSVQEAVGSVESLKTYYRRQRKEEAFDSFYMLTEQAARELNIGEPTLPRYRRQPRRLDDGSEPHRPAGPKEFYRQVYFQACDLLTGELTERFDQEFLKPVVAMERVLINAANGNDVSNHVDEVMTSVFGKDLDRPKLTRHLAMLQDVIHQALPEVKKVTSIRTICSAMSTDAHRVTFSQTHKLLRLYLTVPITSATSERAFSSLKRLLTYLRSTMTEQRLNNCMLPHVHKDIVDDMDLNAIATEFVSLNQERMRYFGK
ncbi:zinc finger MYM-type protein 1-like [Branchiostoma lanceolatum]|uniref:zinc finger MYM-type protein 1-like n=1 Tax=Branchiostoma lanceolatum TaxID=7740 RepID=UPI0034529A86